MDYAGHSDMRNGQLLQSQSGPFECTVCGRSFPRKKGLSRHSSVHFKAATSQCKIVVRHKETSTAEKKYQCHLCDKTFTRKENMLLHNLIHTNEKPFQCKECEKTFRSRSNLKAHMKIHSDHKPFQCAQCGERFHIRKDLRAHDQFQGGVEMEETRVVRIGNHDNRKSTYMSQQECLVPSFSTDAVFLHSLPLVTLQPLAFGLPGTSCLPQSEYFHPNIASTYDLINAARPIIVMERVETSLSNLMRDVGTMVTLRERVDLALGVVCAVDYLHDHVGVIHGCLTADTIFFTSEVTAKVLDPLAAALMTDLQPRSGHTKRDDLRQLGRVMMTLFGGVRQVSSPRVLASVEILAARDQEYLPDSVSQLMDSLRDLQGSKEYRNCRAKRCISFQESLD